MQPFLEELVGLMAEAASLYAANSKTIIPLRGAAVIDYDQFKELYFQNPQFGFRLLHLVVARLQGTAPLPQAEASS